MAGQTSRTRLDQALVAQGLISSRSKARDAVVQGIVNVNGTPAAKPGQLVGSDAKLEITGAVSPYVSRAGLKLAHALDHFGIDPSGLAVLDVGASTGGFTDVLLQRGAAQVTAIDVGHGQFHDSLAGDSRVTVHERLNARALTTDHVGTPPELVTCDVSFISLKLALPRALALAAGGAALIALIKPQFEVGREHLGKGGIVRSGEQQTSACDLVQEWLETEMRWKVLGVTASPITGSDGNREFLIAARKSDNGR